MAFAQIRERLLVVPAVQGHDIRSAAFRSLLLQRLQTLQFPDAWRGPGLEEIQDDVAPAHPVQREAFSAFILEDDVRGAVAAAAGSLGLQRMGSWCRRGKNVFVERRRHRRGFDIAPGVPCELAPRIHEVRPRSPGDREGARPAAFFVHGDHQAPREPAGHGAQPDFEDAAAAVERVCGQHHDEDERDLAAPHRGHGARHGFERFIRAPVRKIDQCVVGEFAAAGPVALQGDVTRDEVL